MAGVGPGQEPAAAEASRPGKDASLFIRYRKTRFNSFLNISTPQKPAVFSFYQGSEARIPAEWREYCSILLIDGEQFHR